MRAIIAGTEHRFEPGETFEVPAGTPHQTTADTAARLKWQVRPALRTAELFERIYTTEPDELAGLTEQSATRSASPPLERPARVR